MLPQNVGSDEDIPPARHGAARTSVAAGAAIVSNGGVVNNAFDYRDDSGINISTMAAQGSEFGVEGRRQSRVKSDAEMATVDAVGKEDSEYQCGFGR